MEIDIKPGGIYTAQETHTYLRVCRTTLWKMAQQKTLVPIRFGAGKNLKYRGEDILALVGKGADLFGGAL